MTASGFELQTYVMRHLQVNALRAQVSTLSTEISSAQKKKGEVEKEQEDLLVFLEELSTKRRRDKERLKTAGLEVSDDEAEGDEDEDEDE